MNALLYLRGRKLKNSLKAMIRKARSEWKSAMPAGAPQLAE